MSISSLLSMFCGMLFGVCVVLLFRQSARASIMRHSTWLTEHPGAYVPSLLGTALVFLIIAYFVSMRFA